ncbi:MAG: WYL domain-containing protein [Muribaculaceae bacterium]|nr:WYL domain-containing protein [Muribaculaceae bacterium]
MDYFEKEPNLFSKYVWVVNTIHRAGRISFDGINEKWRNNVAMSGGDKIPSRTFGHWLKAIKEVFGISIRNEHCGDFRYFIENEEEINDHGIKSWLLDTFSTSQLLASCLDIKDCILLEEVPSGQEFLQPILLAIREKRIIRVTYQGFHKEAKSVFDMQPRCVKLHRQRWYMLAKVMAYPKQSPRVFALDRIKAVELTDDTFTLPGSWNATSFFANSFGVIVDQDIHVECVKLRVRADQAYYFSTLPLHSTQQKDTKLSNDDYTVFVYHLRPTFDFMQEVLKNGDSVEVLEPAWLRREVAERINQMAQIYKND